MAAERSDPEPASDLELDRAKARAFSALAEVGEALEHGSPAAMAAAAERLRAEFEARPDDDTLPGFGAMALDAALWLIDGGCEQEALSLCTALVGRLAGGDLRGQSVTAGARFLETQALSRLGREAQARVSLGALCMLGEPALAGLDRLAGRLVATGASPRWHAQLAAASVTVLWRLGRGEQARAIAREAAETLAGIDEPRLAAVLRALEREIAGQ